MKQIVLASNNKGKINEIKKVFKNYDVLSISDMEKILNKKLIVTENGDTFRKKCFRKSNNII